MVETQCAESLCVLGWCLSSHWPDQKKSGSDWNTPWFKTGHSAKGFPELQWKINWGPKARGRRRHPGAIFFRPLLVKGTFCAMTSRVEFLFRGKYKRHFRPCPQCAATTAARVSPRASPVAHAGDAAPQRLALLSWQTTQSDVCWGSGLHTQRCTPGRRAV